MDHLIYTAYSGLTGSMVSQQVIASNMANAQTIGFRAEMLNHQPTTLKGPSIEARAMTQGDVRGANMKQGTMIETGLEPSPCWAVAGALAPIRRPAAAVTTTMRLLSFIPVPSFMAFPSFRPVRPPVARVVSGEGLTCSRPRRTPF